MACLCPFGSGQMLRVSRFGAAGPVFTLHHVLGQRLPARRVWGNGCVQIQGLKESVMLLVTGGAGFIGSNVVAALNDAGRADVAVCDYLGSDAKWRNLAKRQLADFVAPAELLKWLEGR